MKVFSPSQTKNYLTCPMLWHLSRQKWRPKTYNKASVYAIRGSAVSSGLELYNQVGASDVVLTRVVAAIADEWTKSNIDHREWSEYKTPPPTQAEITQQAIHLVEAYMESPVTAFKVLYSEYIFKKHGYARADVIGRLASGQLLPVDYKCKDVPYQAFYQYVTKRDYQYDWQLMHYVWATAEEFETPCLQFGIVVLWYDKKPKIEYVPYSVDPHRLGLWLVSARAIWADMELCEAGKKIIVEAAEHRTKFGACTYATACLEMYRDPELMLQRYYKEGG